MTCTEARDAMLVAEPAELRGEPESALSAHLDTCAECRRMARVLADSTTALGESLRRRSARRVSRVPGVVAAASALAAAAIVFIVAANEREHEHDAKQTATPSALPVVRHVSLEVARGQRATVLTTADPRVTVIWLSSGEGK